MKSNSHLSYLDAMGGEETMKAIVSNFFAGIPSDPVLSELYLLDDLDGAQERLFLFLVQYWGGRQTYSELRGHPRLRMRHQRFAIDVTARDAWLSRMKAAVEAVEMTQAARDELWRYLETTARGLQNLAGDSPGESSGEDSTKLAETEAGSTPILVNKPFRKRTFDKP